MVFALLRQVWLLWKQSYLASQVSLVELQLRLLKSRVNAIEVHQRVTT